MAQSATRSLCSIRKRRKLASTFSTRVSTIPGVTSGSTRCVLRVGEVFPQLRFCIMINCSDYVFFRSFFFSDCFLSSPTAFACASTLHHHHCYHRILPVQVRRHNPKLEMRVVVPVQFSSPSSSPSSEHFTYFPLLGYLPPSTVSGCIRTPQTKITKEGNESRVNASRVSVLF